MLVFCPSCQKSLNLPDQHIGKKVRCPGCKNVFLAEAGEGDAIQSAPPPPVASPSSPRSGDPPPPRRRPRDEDEAEDRSDHEDRDRDDALRIARRAAIYLFIAACFVLLGRGTVLALNFVVDAPVAPNQNPNDPAFKFGQGIGVSCCGAVVLAIAIFILIAGTSLWNLRSRGMILTGCIISIVESVLELILIGINAVALVVLSRNVGVFVSPSVYIVAYVQIAVGAIIMILALVAGIMGLRAVNNEAVRRILNPPRRRRSRDYDEDD